MVNRVWQYHFGRGLVATTSDFGQLGKPPSHPELLDWLASRFVNDDGWRLKPMHRLIMTSAAYRQAALRPAPEVARMKDPDNRWLWRMNTRRLDAEQVRDAMLAVSGELQPEAGGPPADANSSPPVGLHQGAAQHPRPAARRVRRPRVVRQRPRPQRHHDGATSRC